MPFFLATVVADEQMALVHIGAFLNIVSRTSTQATVSALALGFNFGALTEQARVLFGKGDRFAHAYIISLPLDALKWHSARSLVNSHNVMRGKLFARVILRLDWHIDFRRETEHGYSFIHFARPA